MLAATTSPWYLPTWVSGQSPVTSPIAQRFSATRRWASTGTPRGSDSTPTVEHHDVVLAVAPGRGHADVQSELDPLTTQDLAQLLTERSRIAGEHMLGPIDDDDLAAESSYYLGHLDTHGSATQDQQARRHDLHRGRLSAAPHAGEALQAGYRWRDRISPVGQHHVVGGVAYAVNLDNPWTGEPAGATQQVDVVVGQPVRCPLVGVVRDHEVAPGEHRLHIDLSAGSGVPRSLRRLTRTQQALGRDAGPVGALTPHQLALDDRDPQAALDQRTGTVLARRTTAEHDHVVLAGHVGRSSPARSRTMKSAYQSGQSGSASPVRSSCRPCASAARLRASARSLADSYVVSMGGSFSGRVGGS